MFDEALRWASPRPFRLMVFLSQLRVLPFEASWLVKADVEPQASQSGVEPSGIQDVPCAGAVYCTVQTVLIPPRMP